MTESRVRARILALDLKDIRALEHELKKKIQVGVRLNSTSLSLRIEDSCLCAGNTPVGMRPR